MSIEIDKVQELFDNNPTLVNKLIERWYSSDTLPPNQFVPKSVDGRRSDYFDRLLSGEEAKNLNEFYVLVNEAINDRLDRENVPQDERLIFTEAWPPDAIKTETITYRLLERSPGTVSQGKLMNKEKQNWKPMLRQVLHDPDHPNKKLYIYGQWLDNMIELCCWARTSKVANARALWLEDLMEEYSWFFSYKGVSSVRFEGRGADSYQNINDNALHCRPLRYFVRTDRITKLSEFVINKILVNTFIDNNGVSGG